MQKQFFFLSGIARSGSTLLGSILNQDPRIFVSPTSPLLDLFCLTEESLQRVNQQYTFDLPVVSPNIHRALYSAYYENIDKPIIIDKHRGWPRNIATIKSIITPNPKVICTYRPTAENITSFLKLINKDPDNFVDRDLRSNRLEITTRNRAIWLWEKYSNDPFYSMQDGLLNHRDNILVVRYDDIVTNISTTLENIYSFMEIDMPVLTVSNIINTCAENDAQWGMKNLHTLRPILKKTSDDPLTVLGAELFEYFNEIDKQLDL